MTTNPPVIIAEQADWVALGGQNWGIAGDPTTHFYGFHLGANEIPSSDYSRWRDPNGSDGPYVDWRYACAGDFAHMNNESLRARHRDVLARLMQGEFPMICEFIGKPWADQPVYYWARWNGVTYLERYTGVGHDTWSHISWYRSMVDQRAHLWTSGNTPVPVLRRPWPSYMPSFHFFGLVTGPAKSHGGYYVQERADVKAIQQRLIVLGYVPGITNPNSSWADGIFEQPTKDAVAAWQRKNYAATTSYYGEVWSDDWRHLFTY